MATYSNQHWLLSHIRNSFVSTDDTGICETVMQSDDLPKHYLRKFQSDPQTPSHRKSNGGTKVLFVDRPLQEVDFVCYPGLDHSDDEDIDLTSQSFDIQMYPEMGAHRFRSNTAQKLERMEIARRKAARMKCVNFNDDVVPPEDDLFERKPVAVVKVPSKSKTTQKESELSKGVKQNTDELEDIGVKSKLAVELANSPKQMPNKFMEYARFDGTSQSGVQVKRINVFLHMLKNRDKNYPIKICMLANAKIHEVIGLVCYKAAIQYPDVDLKSARHYALYLTEDNDDMEDFPPLDEREPCSKFGFSHLTLAERRPIVPVTEIEYSNQMTSEKEKARLAAAVVRSVKNKTNFILPEGDEIITPTDDTFNDEYESTLSHNEILEAPLYRTYRVHLIDKRFFKIEATLGVSGERIEIDQQRHAKFWSKQKAITYPIDAVAHVEIVERRSTKSTVRIYVQVVSSVLADIKSSNGSGSTGMLPHSPTSPGHSSQMSSSPFNFFSTSGGHSNHHYRFKHYDFEAYRETAEHILNKLKCILEVRSSEARREFLLARERKLEKHSKKQLKL